uniref:Uncharacterized protein n=1 Tax=Avena sativa TaxID=4498 RepID=A0ACD5X827_AVESA
MPPSFHCPGPHDAFVPGVPAPWLGLGLWTTRCRRRGPATLPTCSRYWHFPSPPRAPRAASTGSAGPPANSPAAPSSVVSGGLLYEEEEVNRESFVLTSSERPDSLEVFMPPGYLEAARRLAVVWLEPPNGFFNPSQSMTEALFHSIPHLQFELVPSGIGATYVRFRSHATREMAMALPDIMHEDVRIRLEREEDAQCVPLHINTCTLLWASPLAAEHVTPDGVTAFFRRFREVLEIDPICVMGRDMSVVKAIVLLETARGMPNNVWPVRGPWGTRVVRVEVVKVWPYERSFVDGEYHRYFGPPPLLPFRHSRRMPLYGRASARGGADPDPLLAPQGAAPPVQGRRALALLLEAASPLMVATRAFCSPPHLGRTLGFAAPPPSPLSSLCGSEARSETWSDSGCSVITSAASSPDPYKRRAIITELANGDAERVPGPVTAGLEDAPLAVLATAEPPAARKSSRLAAKEPEMYMDMVTKAVKFRELKDTLKSCSARLQAHVSKNKLLNKLSPMGMKSVSALKAAAFGSNSSVPGGADD